MQMDLTNGPHQARWMLTGAEMAAEGQRPPLREPHATKTGHATPPESPRAFGSVNSWDFGLKETSPP